MKIHLRSLEDHANCDESTQQVCYCRGILERMLPLILLITSIEVINSSCEVILNVNANYVQHDKQLISRKILSTEQLISGNCTA